MYEFENIVRSEDGAELFARCRINRTYAIFNGHFEGQPLMPAAAQLQMIDEFIRSDRQDGARIIGGRTLKFVQQIHPDDMIHLLLRYRTRTMVDFFIQKEDASLASKGTLMLMGGDVDN